jgi:lipoprotein-anchoring transpeptidase ErfK/SrfK
MSTPPDRPGDRPPADKAPADKAPADKAPRMSRRSRRRAEARSRAVEATGQHATHKGPADQVLPDTVPADRVSAEHDSADPANADGASRASRRSRRRAQTRGRGIRAVLVALASVALTAGSAAAGILLRDDGHVEAKATPTTSTTTTTSPPAFDPFVTATSNVPEINAYDAPADTAGVIETFSQATEYLAPRTFLVLDEQPGWLQVLLPMRPNGSLGWIRETEITRGASEYEIRVELSTTKVTLLKAGEVVLETLAGVGKDETPTPLGQYYITDPVDLTDRPNGAYGAYALGISGYSEVLMEFNGGPGQIAIHGTTNPSDAGQKISNGCIRVTNDIIFRIAAEVPIGTPLTVVA